MKIFLAGAAVCLIAGILNYWPVIDFYLHGKRPEAKLVAGLIWDGSWRKLDYVHYRDPETGCMTFIKDNFSPEQKMYLEILSREITGYDGECK